MKPTKTSKTNRPSILLASAGVFSTGINVKSIHNIILAFPTKSTITLLQSIGRGLRKLKDKKLNVIDISDNFKSNITFKHFLHRLDVYKEQNFVYNTTNVFLDDGGNSA